MPREAKSSLLAAVCCALAVGALGLVAYAIDPFQVLDARLLGRAIEHRYGSTGQAADTIAHLADPLPLLIMLGLAWLLALWRGRPLQAAGAIAIVAGANVTTQLLKVALAHPRFQAVLGPHQIGPVAFPSGHATAAASIAIAWALVVPYWARPLATVAGAGFYAAVGASVMILGWHYPSDVLGGGLVAAAWGFAVLAVLQATAPREKRRERISSPGPGPLPSR